MKTTGAVWPNVRGWKGDWLVAMPEGLDGRKAMAIGTAGFTAMLCVMALEDAGIRRAGW